MYVSITARGFWDSANTFLSGHFLGIVSLLSFSMVPETQKLCMTELDFPEQCFLPPKSGK